MILLTKTLTAAASAILLALTSAAEARTYYVSPGGNDSNSGTSTSAPWRSIAKVNSKTFQAGDSILFQGGHTFDGAIFLTPATVLGTSSTPTTIASYGRGRATLRSSDDAVTIGNLGNIAIKNLRLSARDAGILAYNDTASTRFRSIHLTNLDILSPYVGIYITAWGPNQAMGFSDVGIRDVNIKAPTGSGIYIAGNDSKPFSHRNVVIDGVHIWRHGGDGIGVIGIERLVIQNALIHDGGGQWNGAIELNYVNNGLVQYNEAYNQVVTPGGVDGGGIDLDESVTNTIVQFNYVHDNAGPGFSAFQGTGIPWADNVFRYNISQNNGRGPTNVPSEMVIGAYGQNGITGLQVYGNTFYTSVGSANVNSVVRFEAANSAGIVANNIFYVEGANPRLIDTQSFKPTNMLFRGNTYYTTHPGKIIWGSVLYSSLSAWQSATNQEKIGSVNVARTENPRLINPGGGGILGGYYPEKLEAYKLRTGSPAIDAGLDIRTLFGIDYGRKDFYGVTIPRNATKLNIGASEDDTRAQ